MSWLFHPSQSPYPEILEILEILHLHQCFGWVASTLSRRRTPQASPPFWCATLLKPDSWCSCLSKALAWLRLDSDTEAPWSFKPGIVHVPIYTYPSASVLFEGPNVGGPLAMNAGCCLGLLSYEWSVNPGAWWWLPWQFLLTFAPANPSCLWARREVHVGAAHG